MTGVQTCALPISLVEGSPRQNAGAVGDGQVLEKRGAVFASGNGGRARRQGGRSHLTANRRRRRTRARRSARREEGNAGGRRQRRGRGAAGRERQDCTQSYHPSAKPHEEDYSGRNRGLPLGLLLGRLRGFRRFVGGFLRGLLGRLLCRLRRLFCVSRLGRQSLRCGQVSRRRRHEGEAGSGQRR